MKMAYRHEKTQAFLHGFTTRKASAVFFFHDRGSLNQKSFVGLLCSILYQILEALPEICECLIPALSAAIVDYERRISLRAVPLSIEEL